MAILLFITITSISCKPDRYDGPYRGKSNWRWNRQTDWGRSSPWGYGIRKISTAGGGVSSYYDAKETVDGQKMENSRLKELKGRYLHISGKMNVLIFKAGYEYVGSYEWDTLKVDSRKITWKGKSRLYRWESWRWKRRRARHVDKENSSRR